MSSNEALLMPPGVDPAKWDRASLMERADMVRTYNALLGNHRRVAKALDKVPGQGATRFTTQYALDWAKREYPHASYERERYDARTRRHHDLEMGADVVVRLRDGGVVFVQGAGRSERKTHKDRFEAHGGVDALERRYRNATFYYLEFERGQKEPFLTEVWFRSEDPR